VERWLSDSKFVNADKISSSSPYAMLSIVRSDYHHVQALVRKRFGVCWCLLWRDVQMVGRIAYIWGYPLVNAHNRRKGLAKVSSMEPGYRRK